MEKKQKNTLLRFLFSKVFWKQLLIMAIIAFVLIIGVIFYLTKYTQHGKEFPMPDLTGKNIYDIELGNTYPQIKPVIIDSVYANPDDAGNIVKQNPLPGEKVKQGRKVYITVVASGREMTKMPDLKDLSLRLAINILKIHKLKAGEINYKPSFAANAVLQQYFHGDTISPGDTLPAGSVIDLDVGKGEGRMELNIPFLYGMTRMEAIEMLTKASFNLGQEIFLDSVVNDKVLVFEQRPGPYDGTTGHTGDTIRLWYRSPEKFDFKPHLDSLRRLDSLQRIIEQQFENQEETSHDENLLE